jgi:hypothetical protein
MVDPSVVGRVGTLGPDFPLRAHARNAHQKRTGKVVQPVHRSKLTPPPVANVAAPMPVPDDDPPPCPKSQSSSDE